MSSTQEDGKNASTTAVEVVPTLVQTVQRWKVEGQMSDYLAFQVRTLLEQKDAALLGVFSLAQQAMDNASVAEQAEAAEMMLSDVKKYMMTHFEKIWNELYSDCSTSLGKKLSKHERTALNIKKPSLVYGEVSFAALGELIFGPHLKLKSGEGVFYDLGSGTGRAVFAASYLHNFEKCWGIEILDGLTSASVEVLEKYDQKQFRSKRTPVAVQDQKIGFTRASFLDIDWSDADVLFCNSTCFDDELMEALRTQAKSMKPDSYCVTLTKQLKSPHFRLVDSTPRVMSWGYATIHIQQRLPVGQTIPVTVE
jgi:SAM-dependent methyltransferase